MNYCVIHALKYTSACCSRCRAGQPPEPREPEVAVVAPTPRDTKETNPKDAIGDTKAPLHLCSPIAEAHWALAQFAGLTKYGAWNWRAAGVRSSIYIAAIKRHVAAYISGEEFDPVDGTHHLGNIMACCAILLEARECNKLTDDRPPMVTHRRALEYVEGQMARLKVHYADKAPRHYTIADTDELGHSQDVQA